MFGDRHCYVGILAPRSRPAVAHELPLPAASARLLDNRFQLG